MASTYRLDSAASYQGRYMYLSCTQRTSIADNKSFIDWTLTVTGGTSNYYTTGPTTVKINGQTVYYKGVTTWDTYSFPAKKDSVHGTIEVPHNADGNKTITCSISTAIYYSAVYTSSSDWSLDKITRQAFINRDSVQPFDDEQNPSFTFQKAGAGTLSVWLEPNLTGTHLCERSDISNTGTYTWSLSEAEKDQLRAACAKNSCPIRVGLCTTIDGVNYDDYVDTTYDVINATPTLTATIEETNQKVRDIVGSIDALVRNRSKVKATATYSFKKMASLESYSVKNGTNIKSENPATFDVGDNGVFEFDVTDSRGNSPAPVTIAKTVIPYVMLSCTLDKAQATVDGETGYGEIQVGVSGNYYNGSIGSTANTLILKVQYREQGSSNWIDGGNISNTKSGTTYSGTTTISGLDHTKAYEVRVYAEDVFNEAVYSATRIAKAVPIFDWGEKDFRINGDFSVQENAFFEGEILDKFGKAVRNGFVAYTGNGAQAIDPNTTLEEVILTNHENGPGTHYIIQTFFYNSKNADSNRSQFAIPYATPGPVMHRFRYHGSWSAWTSPLDGLSDYIIATGTDGIWTWEKWASGKAECWGRKNHGSVAITTSWGNIYCTADAVNLGVDFPSGLFVDTPQEISANILYSGGSDTWISGGSTEATSAKTGNMGLCRAASRTVSNLTMGYYAIGRWK